MFSSNAWKKKTEKEEVLCLKICFFANDTLIKKTLRQTVKDLQANMLPVCFKENKKFMKRKKIYTKQNIPPKWKEILYQQYKKM